MHTAVELDGDVTSWLVMAHLAAALATRTDRPADGARLLGAVRALGIRVGFQPEVMDPVDAAHEAAAVENALSPPAFEASLAAGAMMSRDEVNVLVSSILGESASLPGRALSSR